MKLTHKNLLYTAIISGVLTILVLGYFIFMLPSLYVDYVTEENYESVLAQQKGYLASGSYQDVKVKTPACMTIDVPFSQDAIVLTGKMFQIEIEPSTDEMKALVQDIKSFIKEKTEMFEDSGKFEEDAFYDELEAKLKVWKDSLLDQNILVDDLPFDITTQVESSNAFNYENETMDFRYVSDNTIIFVAGVDDGETKYSNFVAVTYNKDRLVVSYLPAMTPQMNEITPIVVRSLPMLLAVIVLFALIVSSLYTKGIVDPILRLVKHTEVVKQCGDIKNAQLLVKGNDEIAMLVQTLNDLYSELTKNYTEMEDKNEELEEKNQSKEVFLRASSHQLKTPIAAALLLVDGMINQIGKYQDTKVYLPEVKKQLLSMRRIVDDILSLSRHEESLFLEKTDVTLLVAKQLTNYQVTAAEHHFTMLTEYSADCFITTDAVILVKVIDNLISNAFHHSREGATITIKTSPEEVVIINSKAHIDEALLKDIFEPFVSGQESGTIRSGGHGLGLSIAAYYAKRINARIEISNVEDGVKAKILFGNI